MATRRTEIQVQVQGIEQLRSLNTSLNTYEKHLGNIANLTQQLGGTVLTGARSFDTMTQAQGRQLIALTRLNQETLRQIQANTQASRSLQSVGGAAEKTQRSTENLLGSLIKYRVVGAVFGEIERAIRSAADAWVEYDRQARRTTRITGPQDYAGTKAALMASGPAYNAEPGQAGEAYYQIATFIQDATARAKVFDQVMRMLVGTEGDAREVSRALVMTYEQFADQLPKTIDQAEKLNRISEMMTGAFRRSHLEINELATGLRYLGPIAQSTGMHIQETFALLETLAFFGQRGGRGGTQGLSQAVGRLVTDWKSELSGGPMPRSANGGLDWTAMMLQLKRVHDAIPLQRQAEWEKAIIGSQAAWRAFAVLMTQSGVDKYLESLKHQMDDFAGKADEKGALAAERLNTYADQFGRAWKGVINEIAQALDGLAERVHLKGWLKDVADYYDQQGRRDVAATQALNSGPAVGRSRARLDILNQAQKELQRQAPTYTRQFGPLRIDRPAYAGDWIYVDEIPGLTSAQRGWLEAHVARRDGLAKPRIYRDDLSRALSVQQQAYQRDVAGAAMVPPGGVAPAAIPGIRSAAGTDVPDRAGAAAALAEMDRKKNEKAARERERAEREKEREEEQRRREAIERYRDQQSMADARYELAMKEKRYADAQRYARQSDSAAYSIARLEGDRAGIFRLNRGLDGRRADFRLNASPFGDMSGLLPDLSGIFGDIMAYQELAHRQALRPGASMGNASYFGSLVNAGVKRSLFNLEMAQRPEFLAYGSDQQRDVQQRGEIVQRIQILQQGIHMLEMLGQSVTELSDDLARANHELQNFDDRVRSQQMEEVFKALGDFGDAVAHFEIEATTRQRERARELAIETRANVKEQLNSGVVGWMRGRNSLGDVAQSLGDTIIDTALTKIVSKWTDPLVTQITAEILAIGRNIDALNALTSTLGGTPTEGGPGGATGGGAAGDMGPGGRLSSNLGKWNTGNFLAAGSAAYSVFNQGASQGVTLGGLLSGALTGFSLGGPLGAGIGAGLDLLGGLFGHRHSPSMQEQQPAFYNAPSDFEYNAYRYRITGKGSLPGGHTAQLGTTPVIHVYIDGARVAAQQVVTREGSLARVSLSNPTYDLHRPT